jgi:hypothetical protein
MKVLLDSNVWRYFADHDGGNELVTIAKVQGIEIAVAPALVFEARALMDELTRKKILKLLANPSWKRVMPEAFLEAEEFKAIVRHFRPEWLIASPDLREVERLRLDWEIAEGGFWSRAANDIAPPITDESLRAEQEHALARRESKEIRERVFSRGQKYSPIPLSSVHGIPGEMPGWLGEPVEYWRVPSLFQIRSELEIYASPYREWIDSEVDITAISTSPESLTKLWFYEIAAIDAPRQWIRGAYEYLQAFHKYTPGAPVDSQIASHLVDVDALISADRNFVRFAQTCRDDAPFALAQPYLVSGGAKGVEETLALLTEPDRLAHQV